MLPFGDLKPSTKINFTSQAKRRPALEAKDKVSTKQPAKPVEVMGLIQNRTPGSTYEWHVAQALWMLGWTFDYQVPVMGGRDMGGGQVLDFLVHTVPMETALLVNGDYWHQMDEEYKNIELMSALQAYGYHVNNRPIVLKSNQSDTFEAAYTNLYALLGKG